MSAAERATALTRQLLSFARRQEAAPQYVDARDIVESMQKLMRRLIGVRHELHLDREDHSAPVYVDRGQLEQVLVNLVINARDAMEGGGRIDVGVRRLGPGQAPDELGDRPAILISVRDRGVGMSPEVMERIFEPFFTTKPVGHGTGLGLATVQGIVRQAGGLIRVHSEVGVGSEFRVYLPENVGPAGSSRGDEATQRGTGQVILIVDDEAVLRSVVSRMLKALGYQTLEACDGFEAIDCFEEHGETIDLLLTDVVMPRMGGVELSQRIQQRWPATQVVLMSGYAQVMNDESLPVIADALLPKPFNRTSLARVVRDVLAEEQKH